MNYKNLFPSQSRFLILLLLVFISTISFAQSFDLIEFTEPQKYGWKDYYERGQYYSDLSERKELLQIYRMNKQSIVTNMMKSALMPGWGHFSADENTKGQVLLGVELLILGSSYYYFDKSMQSYDKYKKATQIDDINSHYNDSLSPYRNMQILLGTAGLIWIYTFFDTISATNDYNTRMWDRILIENKKHRHIKIVPGGIEVRF